MQDCFKNMLSKLCVCVCIYIYIYIYTYIYIICRKNNLVVTYYNLKRSGSDFSIGGFFQMAGLKVADHSKELIAWF